MALSLWWIQALESLLELDCCPKARHYLGLVLMILWVWLDASVVMLGRKHEKKRNQKEVEREK